MLAHAAALGFRSYHLSEHVPRRHAAHLYPEERAAGLGPAELVQRFEAYLAAGRAAAATQPQLGTLVGAETEFIDAPGGADGRADLVAVLEGPGSSSGSSSAPPRHAAAVGKGRVDFLVGGVHHAHDLPIDFDVPSFEVALRASAAAARPEAELPPDERRAAHWALARTYLDQQLALMRAVQPEVIAHFDIFRLWSPELPLAPSGSDTPEEQRILGELHARLRRNVRFAASYGALFEVSGAAVRKGWPTPYPGPEVLEVSCARAGACQCSLARCNSDAYILQLILESGGRLCLSDDAHSPAQVGHSFLAVRAYLQQHGAAIHVLRRDPAPFSRSEAKAAEEERQRAAREASPRPGDGAPTRFERGAEAHLVEGWAEDSFWEQLEPRRAALERQ
jgi:histidinol-phosphatase (PHP family)